MIDLKNLTLGYGGNAVIRDANLKIAADDFIVIGGPNGGGKSTLLRGISGLISPISGTIDRSCTRYGYVPQHATIEQALPLTAMEMVELGSSASVPWWKTLITRRSTYHHQVLRDCQADSFAKKPFDALSGGQRQRVLLARALASSPNCLLLDEPTAGVDRPTQFALAEMLGKLYRETQISIILITHELAPFKDIAKRFIWIQDGSLHELTASDFHTHQDPAIL